MIAVLVVVVAIAGLRSRSTATMEAAGGERAANGAGSTATAARGEGGGSSPQSSSPPIAGATGASGNGGGSPTTAAPGQSTVPSVVGFEPVESLPTPVSLPVVTHSNTSGLTAGQTVNLQIQAAAGSQVFGAEAFLCRAGVDIRFDADVRPTQTGNCIAHALSPDSDTRVEAAGAPPYQSVDVAFRVGVGTDSYTTQDGRPVSITCNSGNPCQLVLKLQVPNTYAFVSYPLAFA